MEKLTILFHKHVDVIAFVQTANKSKALTISFVKSGNKEQVGLECTSLGTLVLVRFGQVSLSVRSDNIV